MNITNFFLHTKYNTAVLFGAAALGGILALGVFQLALAYILMARGLEDTPAVTASLTAAVEPILNPVLVAVFYHERINPMALLGAVIVVVSVVVYNVGKMNKENRRCESLLNIFRKSAVSAFFRNILLNII